MRNKGKQVDEAVVAKWMAVEHPQGFFSFFLNNYLGLNIDIAVQDRHDPR